MSNSEIPRRILIVEDEPLVAQDIAFHLSDVGFAVAGIKHSGEEALAFLEEQSVEAVIMDITLKGNLDGVETAARINEAHRLPLVYLTSHADRGTIERVKETRPGAYLLKPFEGRDLLAALEMALYNHSLLHPDAVKLSLEFINGRISEPLSAREYEILESMCSGKTNTQLAEIHFLSVNTVKTHLKHVYAKLDVNNRTQALFRINEILNTT